jgi:riboflavin biosynthesis pyrimidine reductase
LTKKSCEQTFPNVKFEACRFHNDGGIDYADLFRVLYENRVESLVVEGGRLLLQNLLDVGIGDELRVETNRTLFVGKGVASPHFKQGESGYVKYNYQEVGDNEIVCYRKMNGMLTL